MRSPACLSVKHPFSVLLVCLCFLLTRITVNAQCIEPELWTFEYPYGECSSGNATLGVNYYNIDGRNLYGYFRWYYSETGGFPFWNSIVSSNDYSITSTVNIPGDAAITVWVSFDDLNTGCESQRVPYTYTPPPPPQPSFYYSYAEKCGNGPAKIQVGSYTTNSFTLYKLVNNGYEYYHYIASNSTGYFEVPDYDLNASYFVMIPGPCGNNVYYQIYPEFYSTDPPNVYGNLSIISGNNTTLTTGGFSQLDWYDAGGNFIYSGTSFTTPALTATTTYQVRGTRLDPVSGGCVSEPKYVTVQVSPPPFCNPELYVYLSNPSLMCRPQDATLTLELYNSNRVQVDGIINWYHTETGGQPFSWSEVHSNEGIITSTVNVYGNDNQTIWASFQNPGAGCETARVPYTFHIAPQADVFWEYALQCGNTAKIKLKSLTPGVGFALYTSNQTNNYTLVESNSTGIFEIANYDPAIQYYATAGAAGACAPLIYTPVYFEVFNIGPPQVVGNLDLLDGTSTTLGVAGLNIDKVNWYDANGNFVVEGHSFTTPVFTPNTYTYQARAYSIYDVCVSDLVTVTVSVNRPPTDYTPLYNDTTFSKVVDLTKPVGTVKGAPGTTSTGAVTYTIPIVTPPGTNGISPSVSINYNSQATNGTVGYGWNIAGLSAVGRMGHDLFHYDKVTPVTYTDQDAFMLDGSWLNPISGANGANGTMYAQDAENFSKIISHGGTANNPDWFEVIAKDGSIMEYGHSTDSRVLTNDGANVTLWRVSKSIDVNGNYVEFKYTNVYRDSRIDEINYTGNAAASLMPYNKLKFIYEVRSDVATTYVAGASFTTKHILKSIAITSEGNKVKTYEFNYGFDQLYSLLKEVTEKGSDDVALNSTIFLYGKKPTGMEVQNTTALSGQYDFFAGDFNADGRTDLMAASVWVNFNKKYHTDYGIRAFISPYGYSTLYSKTVATSSTIVNNRNSSNNFFTNDYNGDGRDDAIEVKVESGAGNLSGYSILRNININITKTNNPNGYEPITYDYTLPNVGYTVIEPTYGNFMIPGDFDGDGNQDLITILGSASFNNPANMVYNAFFTSPSTNMERRYIFDLGIGPNNGNLYHTNSIATAKVLMPVDFDGDGKQELLVLLNSGCRVFSFQKTLVGTEYVFSAAEVYSGTDMYDDHRIYPGDFNGDSKTDLLVKQASGAWKIVYGTGAGYVTAPFTFNNKLPAITGNVEDDKLVISDFNGDGRSDILHGYNLSNGASKLGLYYSKGNNDGGFLYEIYDYANPLAVGVTVGFVVGDFNGDGRSDILNRFNVYPNGADFIYFKSLGKERTLAKVTDGHNVTSSFEYKLLTDNDYTTFPHIYNRTVSLDDPANLNPFNYIELPVQVVSSITNIDGTGGLNTTSLTYENAVVHRAAKGFLGFKKVVVKDAAAGITTTTENNFSNQFAVPYTTKQSIRITASNFLLSESITGVSFTGLSTGSTDPKRFKQQTDYTLKLNYLTGSGTETVYSYDNYGNANGTVVKTGAFSGTTITPTHTTTTTASFGIFNSPVPARVTSSTQVNERNGAAAVTQTTAFTYKANGLPDTKTEFSGQTKAVTTTWAYDLFGNTTSTTLSATGITSRVATMAYDAKGRLPVTKKQIGSGVTQTESTTYDFRWGVPLTKTSTDCLTSTFDYDKFGRLINTIMPSGYSVATTMNWDITGNTVYYTNAHYSGGKSDVKTWYDKLGRETKKESLGFNNQWLTQVTTYDAKGNVFSKTNPYYATETPIVTTNTYDDYNRLVAASNSVKTINNTYTQLSGGRQEVTVTVAGQTSSQITDATNKVVSAQDKGGPLSFTYDSWGNQTQVIHNGTTIVQNIYDNYGRQTSLVDKNSGTMTYEYDAFGQLIQQTDANGNSYTMAYDEFGRITSRQGPEGTTLFEYYKNAAGTCSNDNPSRVIGFNGIVKDFTFDNLNRVQTETETIDGFPYTTRYDYDIYNNVTKTTYPSGVVVNNGYDNAGNLVTVTGGDNNAPVNLFTGNGKNGFGQYTNYTLGNNKTTENTYTYGFPVRFKTPAVQDLNFTFDYSKGNLMSRYDAIKNLTEAFTYDNLNRLTGNTVNNVAQLTIGYDGDNNFSRGNITSKTDAGEYVYKNDKIHAVAYITNPAGPLANPITISPLEQQISYTAFLKPGSITENNYQLDYVYGADYERAKSILKQNNALIETKYYLGNYEKQIRNGITREIHYVNGGNGLCAIIEREGGVNNFYFVYTDYLGSLLTLTDLNGNVTAEQNFDAWGRNRNAATWQYGASTPVPVWLYRGYTGHEHLEQFALINMNGRLYDPIQGRMLSADNYTGTPYGTQGYNRYSYANNNPLLYTDPDGNFAFVAVLMQAAVGAGTSAAIYSLSAGNNWNWRGFLSATAMGALSGAISSAVGELGPDIFKVKSGSLGMNIASSLVGQIGTNIVTGNDITAGMLIGSVVGGLVAKSQGNWTGVEGGGVIENIIGELAFNATKFGISGAASGFIGALVDGQDASAGALNGFRNGGLSGMAITGLNILTMGPSYVPDQEFEDFGKNNPVFRTGTPLYKPGVGLTLGRNLITRLRGAGYEKKDAALQAHEFGHYLQIMHMGMGKFYKRTLSEYKTYGQLNTYSRLYTLEGMAQAYTALKLGYYVDVYDSIIPVR